MLCNKCQKREAKIYYTEILNGEKKEQHLCEECAAECTSFQLENAGFGKEFSIGGLLSSILGNYYTEQPQKEKVKEEGIKCKSCGTTYEEFQQKGKFGCSDCYRSFGGVLEKSIKQIQGSDTHLGKKPLGYVSQTDRIVKGLTNIEKLSIRLQDAIEKEEFEEAAKIRDELKVLRAAEDKEGVGHA